MQLGIHMTKVWFDDDMIELKISVSDGASLFSNKVYVSYQAMDEHGLESQCIPGADPWRFSWYPPW